MMRPKRDRERDRKRDKPLLKIIGILLILGVWGCNNAPSDPATQTATDVLPLPTARDVPPTFTPSAPETVPPPTPLPTQPSQPTDIPATPIPFDDVVITARMRIPAIAYDRRLEGNIGSELILIDETAAKGQHRVRQALVLIELQQALNELTLAPVPADCDTCIDLEVTFPLDQIAYRGWVQDPILLASLENLFAVTLGPHFSPGAMAGLRRTASPYAPAQTIEVDADGVVWIWQGNQDAVVASFAGSAALLTAVSETVNTPFGTSYTASCEGVPIETLMLQSDLGGQQLITIACPAFTVPLPMLDLYVQFDSLMQDAALDVIPSPDTGLPLTAVLQFQQEDNLLLQIDYQGQLRLEAPSGAVVTDTLTIDQIDMLIAPLVESGEVSLGLTTFANAAAEDEPPTEETAVLFVRSLQGVYDGAWANNTTVEALQPLHTLIATYLNPSQEEATPSPTPAATPENSPTPTATP